MAEPFLTDVHDALRHLYSPTALRKSPLLARWGLTADPSGTSRLRKIITQTIREMEPTNDTPANSEISRSHEILLYRYVQQATQLEVADQLCVSVRHLRRLETAAVELLADRLAQWAPPEALDSLPVAQPTAIEPVSFPALEAELTRLALSDSRRSDLSEVLGAVANLLQPMIDRQKASLCVQAPSRGTKLVCQALPARQILLSLASVGIARSSERALVTLSARVSEHQAAIQITSSSTAGDYSENDLANIEIARRLVAKCTGSLQLVLQDGAFAAYLSLPVLVARQVLLIDDNPDIHALVQRYTTGTCYQVTAATTVDQALTTVNTSQYCLIILDVMMPDLDGWELIGRLRNHPLTMNIPIVVFTVLAQTELALSLGAQALLRKPVSRDEFLEMLGAQVGRAAQARE